MIQISPNEALIEIDQTYAENIASVSAGLATNKNTGIPVAYLTFKEKEPDSPEQSVILVISQPANIDVLIKHLAAIKEKLEKEISKND